MANVSKFLHAFSAFFFYLLGASFFAAYLLMRNELGAPWAAWWLKVADLPLIAVAILYGGTSFYRSVKRKEGLSVPLFVFVSFPLLVLFLFLVLLNFWNILGPFGLPQGAQI